MLAGAAAALGLILVGLSLGTAAWSHDEDRETQERALRRAVVAEEQDLTNYFERSASLTKLLSQNPAFADFYELPGTRREKLRRGGPVIDEVNAALARMEDLFPGRIGEACFIDDSGPENGRAVHGEVAPLSEFSTDETGAPFFRPTFALAPGEVFQARPYVSPDTNDWVIANATPVALPASAGEAIVHFEVPIESFRREAASLSPDFDITVVNAPRDEIVFESAHPVTPAKTPGAGNHQHEHVPLAPIASHRTLPVLGSDDEGGSFEANGRLGAYRHVDPVAHNANDWTVIATSRSPAPTLLASVGPVQIALLVAGIVLFGAAIVIHRAARRAVEETEQMKNDLLGLVSHELRTPLTSIVGYTELLRDLESDGLSERAKDFVEVIDRNAQRELRLVGDLLVLQRVEGGEFRIAAERVDLAALIEAALASARPSAEDEGIELEAELEPVPRALGDPQRLGQVLDNLLSNAIKYTHGGGAVLVRLRREDELAVIEVADSGMGIPADELERLFERMFRASNATELHIPGVGLGLSIVNAIVDAHGGKVSVRSEVGAGTTFRVELPLPARGGEGGGDGAAIAGDPDASHSSAPG